MPSKSKHNKKKKGKKQNGDTKKSADDATGKGGIVLINKSFDVVGGDGKAVGKSCQYLAFPADNNFRADENRTAEAEAKRMQVTDEELFQPPPPKEECGICLLPQKDVSQTKYQECCGKNICCGCFIVGMGGDPKRKLPPSCPCPFCRKPPPQSNEEAIERLRKRCELDDAGACHTLGSFFRTGQMGLVQDLDKGFELLFRAADLGSSGAHLNIAYAYQTGKGLEQDVSKAVHHYQIAAIGGVLMARQNLGCMEAQTGNFERAQKHWMIAACAGDGHSLANVKAGFKHGHVTKDEFAKVLRAHQKSSDEMKSVHRDDFGEPGPWQQQSGIESLEQILQTRIILRQNAANEAAVGTPTPCVELRNTIRDRDELEDDAQYTALFEEMQIMCSKFGMLLKVIIPRSGPGASKIFLEYETAEEAGKVIAAFGGLGDCQHGKIEVVYCDPECLCMNNWCLSIQSFATQDAISHREGLWRGM